MSSDSRESKRRRQCGNNGGDEDELDLLALYKSDIGDRILSFASGVDLCTLDIQQAIQEINYESMEEYNEGKVWYE